MKLHPQIHESGDKKNARNYYFKRELNYFITEASSHIIDCYCL